MRWPLVATTIALSAVVAGSCSDASDSPPTPSGPDAGIEPYTLDNYCQRAAPLFCAAVRSCCETSFAYDETLCQARWTEEICEPMVAFAREGRFHFFPEKYSPAHAQQLVEGCFEAFGSYAELCEEADFYDYWQWANDTYAHCKIFVGTAGQLEPCDDRADCAGSWAPQVMGCFYDEQIDGGRCDAAFLFGAGSTCPDASIICEEGYYCDAPVFGSEPGTCVPHLPLGAPCSKLAEDPACGWQAHCDLIEGVCVENTKVTEGPCNHDRVRECRSLSCYGDAGERCRHPISWPTLYPSTRVHLTGRLCGAPLLPDEAP